MKNIIKYKFSNPKFENKYMSENRLYYYKLIELNSIYRTILR